jgi:hypothetical protein
MAHEDLTALVLHLVDHNYRATNRDGSPTNWGDLTPLIGSIGVPFNAQVCYAIVAAGNSFPPEDPERRKRIERSFHHLRHKHHVYYEDPKRHLIQPQRIGGSSLVKGAGDRYHIATASYIGLSLELDAARRAGRPPDAEFLYQLGQSLSFTVNRVRDQRNSLINFMWSGLLSDPQVFDAMVRHRPDEARRLADRSLTDSVEQLRRFGIDRFERPGPVSDAGRPLWVDERPLDSNIWKDDPQRLKQPNGPPSDTMMAALDYLYAYWTMRYHRLDEHPALAAERAAVLAPTNGLRLSPPADGAFLPAAVP